MPCGLRHIITKNGFTIVNRAGRALPPMEAALRLGDRYTFRRLRRQHRIANWVGHGMAAAGGLLLLEGLAQQDSPFRTRRITAVGTSVVGAGMIPIGLLLRRSLEPRRVSKYWTPDELDLLLIHGLR